MTSTMASNTFFVKMAVFSDVAPRSLVDINRHFRGAYCLHHHGDIYQTTRRNSPEDSHLHTHRRENLKFQLVLVLFHQYVINELCLVPSFKNHQYYRPSVVIFGMKVMPLEIFLCNLFLTLHDQQTVPFCTYMHTYIFITFNGSIS
jgi:hypothetical protein